MFISCGKLYILVVFSDKILSKDYESEHILAPYDINIECMFPLYKGVYTIMRLVCTCIAQLCLFQLQILMLEGRFIFTSSLDLCSPLLLLF